MEQVHCLPCAYLHLLCSLCFSWVLPTSMLLGCLGGRSETSKRGGLHATCSHAAVALPLPCSANRGEYLTVGAIIEKPPLLLLLLHALAMAAARAQAGLCSRISSSACAVDVHVPCGLQVPAMCRWWPPDACHATALFHHGMC